MECFVSYSVGQLKDGSAKATIRDINVKLDGSTGLKRKSGLKICGVNRVLADIRWLAPMQ